jgi:hypothetical protein
MGYSDPTTDPRELVDYERFQTTAAVEGHLLNVWLDSLVHRPDQELSRRGWSLFEPAATRRWLAWLADVLRDTGRRQVAWWELWQTLPRPLKDVLYWPCVAALLAPLGVQVALAAGLPAFAAVSLDQYQGPGPRQLGRPSLRRNATGIAVGVVVATALVLPMSWAVRQPPVSVSSLVRALTPVLIAVVLFVVAHTAAAPVAEPGGAFVEQLRRDRLALWTRATAAAVVAGTWTAAVTHETGTDRLLAIFVAAVTTLVIVAATSNASGRFTIARLWLALRGRLPWRLISFIQHANNIGVLRSEAGHIEFRYASLQDMLAQPAQVATPAGPASPVPAIKPALARAVIEEMHVLSEVAVHLAQRSQGQPQLAAEEAARADIEEHARLILAAHPKEILERGQEDFLRYRLAHDRLV